MVRLAFQVIRNTEIPSVVFTCDNQRYIFNVPETFQRYYREHRFKMTAGPVFFYTRSSTENFSGIIGMMLTLFQEKLSIDTKMYGPSSFGKLLSVLRYNDVAGFKTLPVSYFDLENMKTSVEGLKRLAMIEDVLMRQNDCRLQEQLESVKNIDIPNMSANDRNDAKVQIQGTRYEDPNLIIIPIKLHHQVQSMEEEEQKQQPATQISSIQYAVLSRKQQGSVNEEKLKELKIEKSKLGQLFKVGHLQMEDGTIVRSEDVRTSETPPQLVLIFDLRSDSEIEQLRQNKDFQDVMHEVEKKTYNLQCVVHLSQQIAVETAHYQSFLKLFDKNENLFCNYQSTSTEKQILQHANVQPRSLKICRDLNQYFPQFFPTVSLFPLPSLPQSPNYLPYFPLYEYILLPTKSRGYQILPNLEMEEIWKEDQYSEEFQSLLKELTLTQSQQPDPRRVIILGTGSMKPGKYRNVSAIMLSQVGLGCNILLDCGEGTWTQLRDHSVDIYQKPLVLWISHAHSDHHLGMLNLIHQLEKSSEFKSQLYVIVPALMMPWLQYYQQFLGTFTKAKLLSIQSLTEKGEGPLQLLVEAFQSQRVRDGNVQEVEQGEILKIAQQSETNAQELHALLNSFGQSIECVPVIHCPQAFGILVRWSDGYKLTYSGDTRPCQKFGEISKDANFMIHEATFSDDLRANAVQNDHSTVREATELAMEANCKNLILTHFSQRFAKSGVNQKSKKKENTQPQPDFEPNKYPDDVYQKYLNGKCVYAVDHMTAHFNQIQDLVQVSQLIGKMLPDDE